MVGIKRITTGLSLVALMFLAGGCEVDSWLDQSVMGRWERTPIKLPILESLDIIDEPEGQPPGLSPVLPEDLIYEYAEYVMGPQDTISVTIRELYSEGADFVQVRTIDDLGFVRLPVLGRLAVSDMTPSELEAKVGDLLVKQNILKDPEVVVLVQQERQRTFSVLGARISGSGGVGIYRIPRPNFRLLDAVALSGGVPGVTKTLYIIRQVDISDIATERRIQPEEWQKPDKPTAPTPDQLLQDALDGGLDPTTDDVQAPKPDAPPVLAGVLDSQPEPQAGSEWVNVNGQWQQVEIDPEEEEGLNDPAQGTVAALPDPTLTQRIIEVPYDRLQEGDLRYNVVIRPADMIRIPPNIAGNVYAAGAIARPGTYALPGDDNGLTMKQLVFAAGGLSGVAFPERVDLIRRIGRNEEAIIRLNLRDIFNGVAPDIFLKPNDMVNFGTSAAAVHIASIRNSITVTAPMEFNLTRLFSLPRDPFGDFTGEGANNN